VQRRIEDAERAAARPGSTAFALFFFSSDGPQNVDTRIQLRTTPFPPPKNNNTGPPPLRSPPFSSSPWLSGHHPILRCIQIFFFFSVGQHRLLTRRGHSSSRRQQRYSFSQLGDQPLPFPFDGWAGVSARLHPGVPRSP